MLKSLPLTSFLIWSGCIVFAGGTSVGQAKGAAQPGAVQGAAAKSLVYEVVSVRPSGPDVPNSAGETANGLRYTNSTLKGLLFSAFGVYRSEQVIGLPGWADSERFDVEAKMDEDSAAALAKLPREERWPQRKLMLQSLLADRFQLKSHEEIRELPVYALVIAKGGPKLKESAPAEAPSMRFSYGSMTWQAMPIDSLTMHVANMVGRLVVNKTGLMAKYDMKLEWAPDDNRGPAANGESVQTDPGPSIFTALQEQLGLKLDSQKAPVPIIIIDHVEKPSGN